MAEAPMLDRSAIAERIPHAGPMVLLDRVIDWDARSITCATRSHLDPANPLREPAGLPVWAGIEYAAQATAVHASLARGDAAPRLGFLASVRDARPHCERLDGIEGELQVRVRLVHDDPAGAIYDFELHSATRPLLTGRAAVMFARGAP